MVDGGIADIRFCPKGVVVLIKDYDVECQPGKCERPNEHDSDPSNGDHFSLAIATNRDSRGVKAREEGLRLMRKEGMR